MVPMDLLDESPESEGEQLRRRESAWARRLELREFVEQRERSWAVIVGVISLVILIVKLLR
jgi:hypothetical protein